MVDTPETCTLTSDDLAPAAVRALAAYGRTADAFHLAAMLEAEAARTRDSRFLDAARVLRGASPHRSARERQAERDKILRRLAVEHFADHPSANARAAAIKSAVDRYRAGPWSRGDADRLLPPTDAGDTRRALLWGLLKTDAPTSFRTILRAIT